VKLPIFKLREEKKGGKVDRGIAGRLRSLPVRRRYSYIVRKFGREGLFAA